MADKKAGTSGTTGKLKISNHWNAISIIALSQTNPLKAIAEFVENSIDAHATEVTLIRGKEKGKYYLKVIDNGQGIDDFKYVATHVADSIKRKLKREGETGIQGEFGIGLLSFWTVGEELTITSAGSDGVTRRMKLVRDNPGYSIRE
ncbi:MAG: ATP-binding protein, partial [Spirochaetia bacterium]